MLIGGYFGAEMLTERRFAEDILFGSGDVTKLLLLHIDAFLNL